MSEREIAKRGGAATLKKAVPDVGFVRIQESDRRFLEIVAKEFGGESMAKILHRVIDEYRRNRYFKRRNESYAALMADPIAWGEEQQERKMWESTLEDGRTNFV